MGCAWFWRCNGSTGSRQVALVLNLCATLVFLSESVEVRLAFYDIQPWAFSIPICNVSARRAAHGDKINMLLLTSAFLSDT